MFFFYLMYFCILANVSCFKDVYKFLLENKSKALFKKIIFTQLGLSIYQSKKINGHFNHDILTILYMNTESNYVVGNLPCYVPFPLNHQVNLLNSVVVGIMQTFGKMLLQVRFEVLVWLFTLQKNQVSCLVKKNSAFCTEITRVHFN